VGKPGRTSLNQIGMLSVALLGLAVSSTALRLAPALQLARPVNSCCRTGGISVALRDDFVLKGDIATLAGYGTVQGLVDYSFAPLASSQPQMFDTFVGPAVMLPSIQGLVLAALWASIGVILGDIDALNPYDVKNTRGVSPIEAAAIVLAPWFASCAISFAILGGLASAFQIGPGLSEAEINFLVGSYVVVAGWRVVSSSVLPPI
jgi:hypothetical protein